MSSASAERVSGGSQPSGSTRADDEELVSWDRPPWAALDTPSLWEDAPGPPSAVPTEPDERTEPSEPTDAPVEVDRRRSRRWPVVVGAAALALVVVGAVAVETIGRAQLAGEVERRLRDSGMTGRVDVTVGSSAWRPSVLGALAGRGLDELDVTVVDGTVGGVEVTRADYRLTDIDGSVSVGSGTVVVRSIGRGDVRIEVPVESIGTAVGTDLVVDEGRLWAAGATPADRRSVDLRVVGGNLELGGDAAQMWGGPVEVPVADDYLLPCRPSVRLDGEDLVLRCSGNELPGVLDAPLSVDPSDPTAPSGELTPPQTIVRDGG